MKDYIFIQNRRQFSGNVGAQPLESCFISSLKLELFSEKLCFVKLCFALPAFSDHRLHIKKHGSVVECYVCVGIQCYDKYVCVRGVRIVGCVFSSSLLVLLFAANMATVMLSLKSLLKAQPPTHPTLNSLRKSELHLRVGYVLAYCSPVCPLEVCAPYYS